MTERMYICIYREKESACKSTVNTIKQHVLEKVHQVSKLCRPCGLLWRIMTVRLCRCDLMPMFTC